MGLCASLSLSQSWDAFFHNVEAGRKPGSAYQAPPTLYPRTVAGAAMPAVVPVHEGVSDAKLIQDHLNVQALIRAYQVRALILGCIAACIVFPPCCLL